MIGLLVILILFYGSMAARLRNSAIQEKMSVSCATLSEKEIYLTVNEVYDLNDSLFVSSDESIASVGQDQIIAHRSGIVDVSDGCSTYKVHVSDLYTVPVISDKEYLPCGCYSDEENDLLDEVLRYKIEEAGYLTRAGAVAAARFLLLQFPYKLAYFYENGRLSGNGTLADGEGRYYHKGLYLSPSRLDDIDQSVSGPQIWGCSLYESKRETLIENGLDCSGFISWALYNAGYECGDLGSGPVDSIEDLSDLGKKVCLKDLIVEELQTGDLVGMDGHIGMIIGMDVENIYVGEAYWVKDLQVRVYSREDFLNRSEWEYVILMDDYYLESGNLTDMW